MIVDYEIFCSTIVSLQAQITKKLKEQKDSIKKLKERLSITTLDRWIDKNAK